VPIGLARRLADCVGDNRTVGSGEARFAHGLTFVVGGLLTLTCLSGCDQSMTGETFDVVIVNDTSSNLWIAQCSNDGAGAPCDKTEAREELKPGETARAGTAVNVPNPWTVRHTQTGAVTGCLALFFADYPSGDKLPRVSLSTASPAQCNE